MRPQRHSKRTIKKLPPLPFQRKTKFTEVGVSTKLDKNIKNKQNTLKHSHISFKWHKLWNVQLLPKVKNYMKMNAKVNI